MKNRFSTLLLLAIPLIALALPYDADAKCGRKLSTDSVDELATFSGAPATGDYIPICDTSANVMKKIDASNIALGGAFNGTVGATTPSTGVFTSIGATLAITDTRAPTADSATTNNGVAVAFTTPVDTTGTNIHIAHNATFTIGNATAGTNSAIGYNFANVTGDAQVDVTAVKIGTGTVLGTSNAIVIGSGWDAAISGTIAPAIDSGQTVNGTTYAITMPANTTGTNTINGSNMSLTVNNATAGTNTVNGWNFANYTGDAQVNVNAINIGTSDGLGTANAISIGTGWDAGIVTDSAVKVNSTNGTSITAIRFTSDAVASGQTSKTTTLTGVTSSSKCVATVNTVPTNSVFLKSAAPGTDQVVVTASADPGASTLAYTVMCMN